MQDARAALKMIRFPKTGRGFGALSFEFVLFLHLQFGAGARKAGAISYFNVCLHGCLSDKSVQLTALEFISSSH